jgi:YcxB-like protein
MKITGKLEWTDLMAAQRLQMQPASVNGLLRYVPHAVVVLVAGWLIYYALGHDPFGLVLAAVLLVIYAAALLLQQLVLIPRGVRRLYEQHKELQAPFSHEITPEALVTNNEFGNINRPWGHFAKWREDQNILLLYLTDVQFVPIPKRFITAEQLEALRARLQENHIRKVGS